MHPSLAPLADVADAPPLAAGPARLLAAILYSVHVATDGQSLSGRDQAALWGTLILPMLAPAAAPTRRPDTSFVDVPPDYTQLLPFHLLHPRLQWTLVAIDRLCTLLVDPEPHRLAALVLEVGGTAPADPVAEAAALAGRVAERALRREAGPGWDSGFGFRLCRRALREVTEEPGGLVEA